MMHSVSSNAMQRSSLAVGMCLLAFLFALEAKFAWYSPSSVPLSTIQSAKARPSDAPDPVTHAVAVLSSISQPFAMLLLVAFCAVDLVKASPFLETGTRARSWRGSAAIFLSSDLFFRPPPAR